VDQEVCYERLRPRQIVAARSACPIAYLPIGTIEWHGPHNPTGCDTLTAHALAVRCARAGGGLVMPPLWYGESREEGLMEANAADREQIHAFMELPSAGFAPGFMRFTPQQQYETYQRLLLHCLCQLQSLGFRVIVVVAGHYPLLDHARAACHLFHQARFDGRRARTITWAFTGHELVADVFPQGGDHAGFWETSIALALFPELTDLGELPADPATPAVGTITTRPIRGASAEYGERVVALIVERATAAARDRLEHPEKYYPHGLRL